MKKIIAWGAGLFALAVVAAASPAEAQYPPSGYGPPPGYTGHPHGPGGYGYGGAHPVSAAVELAQSAEHLADVTRSVGFEPWLVRDAYQFAEQADHFARLLSGGGHARSAQRDFQFLARDFQQLESNFQGFGYAWQGRHVHEDFAQVRLAFHRLAQTMQYAYAGPGYGPGYGQGYGPPVYGPPPPPRVRPGPPPVYAPRGPRFRFQVGF